MIASQCRLCHELLGEDAASGVCARCAHVADTRPSRAYPQGVWAELRNDFGLPQAPTEALPGSSDKVAILMERAAAGRALWHPKDGRPPLPPDDPAWSRAYIARLQRAEGLGDDDYLD